MTPEDVESALATAKTRGYLLIAEPFDAESPEHLQLLNAWNEFCDERGRHRVLVLLTEWGLWRTAIAFHGGPAGELAYVRGEIEEAFLRHLGGGPRKDEEAWFGSCQDRRRAEALAFELTCIDMEERDLTLENVFQVHAL